MAPGASGSSAISAMLLTPWGNPLQLIGGDLSAPSHVYWTGIRSPASNAELAYLHAHRGDLLLQHGLWLASAATQGNNQERDCRWRYDGPFTGHPLTSGGPGDVAAARVTSFRRSASGPWIPYGNRQKVSTVGGASRSELRDGPRGGLKGELVPVDAAQDASPRCLG